MKLSQECVGYSYVACVRRACRDRDIPALGVMVRTLHDCQAYVPHGWRRREVSTAVSNLREIYAYACDYGDWPDVHELRAILASVADAERQRRTPCGLACLRPHPVINLSQ